MWPGMRSFGERGCVFDGEEEKRATSSTGAYPWVGHLRRKVVGFAASHEDVNRRLCPATDCRNGAALIPQPLPPHLDQEELQIYKPEQ